MSSIKQRLKKLEEMTPETSSVLVIREMAETGETICISFKGQKFFSIEEWEQYKAKNTLKAEFLTLQWI